MGVGDTISSREWKRNRKRRRGKHAAQSVYTLKSKNAPCVKLVAVTHVLSLFSFNKLCLPVCTKTFGRLFLDKSP